MEIYVRFCYNRLIKIKSSASVEIYKYSFSGIRIIIQELEKQMKKRKIHKPGRPAKFVLHIGLPVIVLASVALLLSYLTARQVDPVWANLYYPQLLEYPIASVAILLSGFLLIEITDQERKNLK